MRKLSRIKFVAATMAATTLGLWGCATEDYVDKHVATVDAKVTATQNQVDQHEAQLGKLDQAAQDALRRAAAAGKLAEGKFLYSAVLSDDSVKFPPDSSKLSQEAEQRLLNLFSKLMHENRNVYLEIQGYTDSTGSTAINQRLGAERAEAVRFFMNQHGLPLNRMATISYGAKNPVASNKTSAGRSENRRVAVIVMA